jgi:predicted amidohydrolase YtcJ
MISNSIEKMIIFGGSIITMDDNQPFVDAVGIEGEKIIVVGNLEEVKNKMVANYNLIDLKGKTLLPGFIDCHLHPILFLFYYVNPNLSNVKSLKELQSIMKEAAKKRKTDELLIGLNLKEENFKIPVLPTRWDLDEACPNNPVFVLRYDGHIGIANSKALELAGIDKNTEVPEGGEIRRDQNGELTGILSEQALSPLFSKISLPDTKELNDAANKAFKVFAEKGITSLQGILHSDAGGELGDFGAVEISILKSIQDRVLQNWYALISTQRPKKLKRLKKSLLDDGKKDSKFKVGGLKLFLDGTFGAKTACLYEPFSDAPNMCGFCIVEEEEIYNQMKEAHNNGFQIGIHAIGDKGNRITVDLYKRLLEESPREDHRHRIEHASMLTDDVIKDMKKLGLIASCQPPFINSEYMWLEKRIGKERCKYTYPMKSLVDAGVVIASGSDCPIEDPSVILGLHALVNRNDFIPEQCISMEEALKSYTINAAYAAFEENIKGSIEVGKLADLVILDKNPLEISKNKIKEIQVLETIIRGKSIYKKNN